MQDTCTHLIEMLPAVFVSTLKALTTPPLGPSLQKGRLLFPHRFCYVSQILTQNPFDTIKQRVHPSEMLPVPEFQPHLNVTQGNCRLIHITGQSAPLRVGSRRENWPYPLWSVHSWTNEKSKSQVPPERVCTTKSNVRAHRCCGRLMPILPHHSASQMLSAILFSGVL